MDKEDIQELSDLELQEIYEREMRCARTSLVVKMQAEQEMDFFIGRVAMLEREIARRERVKHGAEEKNPAT